MKILTLQMKYCQEWSIYLVYIYNSFNFNSFLTFLLPLTFTYVFTSLNYFLDNCVGWSKSCTSQETYFLFQIWCKSQEGLCKLSLSCFICSSCFHAGIFPSIFYYRYSMVKTHSSIELQNSILHLLSFH